MASINVSTYSQLKSALEDSDSTEILLTSDIELTGGGKINTAKGDITIDLGGFTVTDKNSSSLTDTLYVPASSPNITITLKNGRWKGRNYYGVIGVYDGNELVTLSLDGITYEGPQLVYNKNGGVKLSNCQVVIDKNDSSTNPQELCECNHLTISEMVIVNSNSTSTSVMWFSGNSPSLIVEENGYLEINALYTYFFYSANPITLLFKKGSTTFINTKSGLFSSASHSISSLAIEENGIFSSSRNSTSTLPLLKCQDSLIIGENANFSLYSPEEGTSPLIQFSKQATITITSPQSVVLYNNGGNALSFSAGSETLPNKITLTTEMLRLWDKATTPITSAGGLEDVPTSEYHRAYYVSDFTTNINLSSNRVLQASSDLESYDIGYPIDENIAILTSQVIAMGKVSLNLDVINDLSTQITGISSPLANLLASFGGTEIKGRSASNGDFSLPLSSIISPKTEVTISANKDFLTKSLLIVSEGSLSIIKLPPLIFRYCTVKPKNPILYRKDDDWEIQVKDSRDVGNEWYLYAYTNSTLTSGDNIFYGTLNFKNAISLPLTSTPILIYTGVHDENNQITKISWEKAKGFLLSIDNSRTHIAGKYTTQIFWEVLPYKLN